MTELKLYWVVPPAGFRAPIDIPPSDAPVGLYVGAYDMVSATQLAAERLGVDPHSVQEVTSAISLVIA